MKTKTEKKGAESEDTLLIYFQALKQESERGKIILLASKIDELLCEVIKCFLKPHRGTKRDEDKLFRTMGPLSTFSSHIEVAYRLGLISRTTADCFDILRAIRNDCAHGLRAFSLQDGVSAQKYERFKKLSYKLGFPI